MRLCVGPRTLHVSRVNVCSQKRLGLSVALSIGMPVIMMTFTCIVALWQARLAARAEGEALDDARGSARITHASTIDVQLLGYESMLSSIGSCQIGCNGHAVMRHYVQIDRIWILRLCKMVAWPRFTVDYHLMTDKDIISASFSCPCRRYL